MNKSTALRAFKAFPTSLLTVACRSPLPTVASSASLRPFSSAVRVFAESKTPENPLASALEAPFSRTNEYATMVPKQANYMNMVEQEWEPDTRYHLHIYAHKHNTHITFTKPNRDTIISLSCGNIGFKKAGRSSYDAAYQLAAFVIARIKDMGHIPQIETHKLELIYRGFGQGREAVTKAILGSEGSRIRSHIVKLSDSTRLKFGGTRSKKPRRLG
ncbi:unnamed protein product [Periconia digitata]|uniref:Uncharacterized protein n=1 Tax=Periconia digitata TaxID=1303443 RepID=A0A9W4U400_9PLEO|nr:unnamed protein product [Periconia digitata]